MVMLCPRFGAFLILYDVFSVAVYISFVSVGFSLEASIVASYIYLSCTMSTICWCCAESRDMVEFVAFEASSDLCCCKEWFVSEDLYFL